MLCDCAILTFATIQSAVRRDPVVVVENLNGFTLAILGSLNPVVGTLVHNAGSIFVIINSAFLLKWGSKK